MSTGNAKIVKTENGYSFSYISNGKRHIVYCRSLERIEWYKESVKRGIIPDKSLLKYISYTEEELNKILSNGEKWKWIKGYENKYAISENGNVYSFIKNPNGEPLSVNNKNGWYLYFRAYNDKLSKAETLRVHRVVYEAFCGEIPTGFQIHHKDGNKQNNNVKNLECLSAREHILETIKSNPNILDGMIKYNQNKLGKPNPHGCNFTSKRFPKGRIGQFTKDGELVEWFLNCQDAQKKTGVCARNILQVANKTPYNSDGLYRKQAGGYIWKFESEVVENEIACNE